MIVLIHLLSISRKPLDSFVLGTSAIWNANQLLLILCPSIISRCKANALHFSYQEAESSVGINVCVCLAYISVNTTLLVALITDITSNSNTNRIMWLWTTCYKVSSCAVFVIIYILLSKDSYIWKVCRTVLLCMMLLSQVLHLKMCLSRYIKTFFQ